MNCARSDRLKMGLVNWARVALVPLECVSGELIREVPHDAISGHFGQDRSSRDRQGRTVAANNFGGASDEVPVAVD